MVYDASTRTIDFGHALACLRRGRKVARRAWLCAWLVLEDGRFLLRSAGFVLDWAPNVTDVLATDWEELV